MLYLCICIAVLLTFLKTPEERPDPEPLDYDIDSDFDADSGYGSDEDSIFDELVEDWESDPPLFEVDLARIQEHFRDLNRNPFQDAVRELNDDLNELQAHMAAILARW